MGFNTEADSVTAEMLTIGEEKILDILFDCQENEGANENTKLFMEKMRELYPETLFGTKINYELYDGEQELNKDKLTVFVISGNTEMEDLLHSSRNDLIIRYNTNVGVDVGDTLTVYHTTDCPDDFEFFAKRVNNEFKQKYEELFLVDGLSIDEIVKLCKDINPGPINPTLFKEFVDKHNIEIGTDYEYNTIYDIAEQGLSDKIIKDTIDTLESYYMDVLRDQLHGKFRILRPIDIECDYPDLFYSALFTLLGEDYFKIITKYYIEIHDYFEEDLDRCCMFNRGLFLGKYKNFGLKEKYAEIKKNMNEIETLFDI